MLTSPGRRGTRTTRIALASFAVGLVAGGVMTALAAWLLSGLVSWVPPEWAAGVVGACGLVTVLRDAGAVPLPLPQNPRQIPRTVFDKRPAPAAFQFGLELGTGLRTYLTATAPYLAAIAVFLLADSAETAVLAGASFGGGRFLMLLQRQLSGAGEAWDELVERRIRWIVPVAGVACAALAVWLGLTAV